MPFKSEAQRRKFRDLVRKGEISQATYDEWESETPAKIPERAPKKRGGTVRGIRKPRRSK